MLQYPCASTSAYGGDSVQNICQAYRGAGGLAEIEQSMHIQFPPMLKATSQNNCSFLNSLAAKSESCAASSNWCADNVSNAEPFNGSFVCNVPKPIVTPSPNEGDDEHGSDGGQAAIISSLLIAIAAASGLGVYSFIRRKRRVANLKQYKGVPHVQ